MRKIAALQCPNERWQLLVVEAERVRFIGVYIRPRSTKARWKDLLATITRYRANSRPTIVFGDLNAHHRLWKTDTSDAGGRALHSWLTTQ